MNPRFSLLIFLSRSKFGTPAGRGLLGLWLLTPPSAFRREGTKKNNMYIPISRDSNPSFPLNELLGTS